MTLPHNVAVRELNSEYRQQLSRQSGPPGLTAAEQVCVQPFTVYNGLVEQQKVACKGLHCLQVHSCQAHVARMPRQPSYSTQGIFLPKPATSYSGAAMSHPQLQLPLWVGHVALPVASPYQTKQLRCQWPGQAPRLALVRTTLARNRAYHIV